MWFARKKRNELIFILSGISFLIISKFLPTQRAFLHINYLNFSIENRDMFLKFHRKIAIVNSNLSISIRKMPFKFMYKDTYLYYISLMKNLFQELTRYILISQVIKGGLVGIVTRFFSDAYLISVSVLLMAVGFLFMVSKSTIVYMSCSLK